MKTLQRRPLTEQEAALRAANGKQNILSSSAGRSVGQILRANLMTFFNLLNLGIALALILVGSYRNTLFMGVVLCNAVIGLVQELRAKRIVDKLSILSAGKTTVFRIENGTERSRILPVSELVEGDVVRLHAGDEIPADAVVLSGQIEVNESLLSGESLPVAKQAGDSLLSGSFVSAGTCEAKLTAVGDESFAARLTAEAKRQKDVPSQLMQDVKFIIRIVGSAVVPVGLILFVKSYFARGEELVDAVEASAASMIGMIPEGLVLLTSIALAVGVVHLARQKVLVQTVPCIENLARVDTLCLDKTGTITSGALTVERVVNCAQRSDLRQLLSDYLAAVPDSGATYTALHAAFDLPVSRQADASELFSSERKYSSVTFGEDVYRLGAPEFLPAQRADYAGYLAEGYRVLAFVENDAPLAYLLLRDCLRENAKEVCAYFAEQGVTLKVISGDSAATASFAAAQAGIADAGRYLDCAGLSDEELSAAAEAYTVFGRVTPQQKKTLIAAMQRAGHTAAMTGDGVNDILAMKQADCSISFGSGADAARKAAQVVLLDSRFDALPQVLLHGRRIIGNITRSASLFLVKTCFSSILSVILLFAPLSYPFAPINLTLISSLLIGMPSFFLALEPNYGRTRENFLRTVAKNALPGGVTIVLLLLAVVISGEIFGYEPELVRSLATLATATAAFWNLHRTCRPYRLRHLALTLCVGGAFACAVLLVPNVFMLLPMREIIRQSGWLLLSVCAAAIPIYEGVRALVQVTLNKKERVMNR